MNVALAKATPHSTALRTLSDLGLAFLLVLAGPFSGTPLLADEPYDYGNDPGGAVAYPSTAVDSNFFILATIDDRA